MTRHLTRRDFAVKAAAAATAAALPLWAAFPAAALVDPEPARVAVRPFDLSRVRLRPGPYWRVTRESAV
jgi:hypothetical protein